MNIILRLSLIVILSVLLGYFVIKVQSVRYSIFCLACIVILTISLISYLNATNNKIRFFFDSVKNDDSSLLFRTDIKNKTLRELYKSMNEVNQKIQQLKIENRNQEQYFRILIDHLATGIITFDDRGHIIHTNSSARQLLSAEVLTHIQQIERTDEKLYQAIKTIKPSERRLVSVSKGPDETRLSLKATSVKVNNTELIILSIQDIKNELDEKELESWMKLIRVLMHEIMNSITPITSLSERLSQIYGMEGNPVRPQQITPETISTTLQGLNVIKEQGKGLMSFVESFRKLVRIPVPVKQKFLVADLLSRLEIIFNSLDRNENMELKISLRDPDLEINGDQNLISQVLLNLVKNAIEANENNPSGKIHISAGLDQQLHPEICVTDNGPGISPENLDEIFVPFFTTRESGSGIGLSISRQIMLAHGGNLRVRSEPDRETIFCMNFKD